MREDDVRTMMEWDGTPGSIVLEMDKKGAACVILCLQLSLRHPANTGPRAEIVQAAVDGLIDGIAKTHPAAADILRRGFESIDNVPLPTTPRIYDGHQNRN